MFKKNFTLFYFVNISTQNINCYLSRISRQTNHLSLSLLQNIHTKDVEYYLANRTGNSFNGSSCTAQNGRKTNEARQNIFDRKNQAVQHLHLFPAILHFASHPELAEIVSVGTAIIYRKDDFLLQISFLQINVVQVFRRWYKIFRGLDSRRDT